MFVATSLLFVVLAFVGNVLLGVAVWRSGVLPRWAGALWAAGTVFMYPFGLVYEATIGPASTPPTVLVGALLLVIGGAWMAWSVLRHPSTETVGVAAQPSVQ
jgi:drug/metabolite transporter (DMT)-like permease